MTWRNLNDKGWDKLRAGLAAGDVDGVIAAVWLDRELLSEVYANKGLAHRKRRLIVFFQHAADADVAELTASPPPSIAGVQRSSSTTLSVARPTGRPKPST